MKDLRPNSQRANNAITLIWIVTVVELIILAINLYKYNLYNKALSGLTVTTTEVESIESKALLLGILFIIVFISSAVAFIQWFRRAYFNLHQRASNLEFSEGWAAGAWFVPIVNIGRPYRIMKEMYETTIKFLNHYNRESKVVRYMEIIG